MLKATALLGISQPCRGLPPFCVCVDNASNRYYVVAKFNVFVTKHHISYLTVSRYACQTQWPHVLSQMEDNKGFYWKHNVDQQCSSESQLIILCISNRFNCAMLPRLPKAK